MNILQGFRTIIFNIVAIAVSWVGARYGLELTEEHHTAITVTVISLANIGLRLITKTPIGDKKGRKLLK